MQACIHQSGCGEYHGSPHSDEQLATFYLLLQLFLENSDINRAIIL